MVLNFQISNNLLGWSNYHLGQYQSLRTNTNIIYIVGVFDFGGVFNEKEEKRSVLVQMLLQKNHIFKVPCCPNSIWELSPRKPHLRGDHREAHRESFQTKEDLPIRLLFLVRFLGIFFNCLHFRGGPPGGIMAYMIKWNWLWTLKDA
jgi:hypothetical protein